MTAFEIAAIFLTLTALLAYVNHRFIKLPTTIGVMVISLMLSLLATMLGWLGFDTLIDYEKLLVSQLDFPKLLLDGMLSMLLFAGALHVNLQDLRRYELPIALLAVLGTIVSTVLVAGLTYIGLHSLGFDIDLIWCLLFGALISPTDPIAVMGILANANAPKSVNTIISGESLFNDGVGVVIFMLLLGVLTSGELPTTKQVGHLLLLEAGGGITFGFLLGLILYYMLKSIDSYQEEVLLTLAGVVGGYALASHWHLSAPLAMVVTGLMVGNQGRSYAMSDNTRHYVDLFWELVDEILNAILFVLIGLEIVMVNMSSNLLVASLLAIAICLLARLVVVGGVTFNLQRYLNIPAGAWKVLTWGGLRGGISVALVLQLPPGQQRDLLLTLTYAVVLFSILIQGLTIGKVAKSLNQPQKLSR